MPDQPDLVLFREQPAEWWGPYVVRPHEQATLRNRTGTVRVLEGGAHDVARTPLDGPVDVFWVARKDFRLGFYVEAYSRESILMRLWGAAVLTISDVPTFLNNVVDKQGIYTQEALSDWVRSQVATAIRVRTACGACSDCLAGRAKLIERVKSDVGRPFAEHGLGIVAMEVERVKIPDDAEAAVRRCAEPDTEPDVSPRHGPAVSDIRAEPAEAGVNPAAAEFFKALTGRDMSDVFGSLNVSPRDVMAMMAGSARDSGLLDADGLPAAKVGPADLVLSLFAMKAAQETSRASMTPATPNTCSNCGQLVPAEARFCSRCAAPVARSRRCAKCGRELPSASKFCPSCAMPAASTRATRD